MKHYPVRDFIVTPAEMVAILEEKKVQERKETAGRREARSG